MIGPLEIEPIDVLRAAAGLGATLTVRRTDEALHIGYSIKSLEKGPIKPITDIVQSKYGDGPWMFSYLTLLHTILELPSLDAIPLGETRKLDLSIVASLRARQ